MSLPSPPVPSPCVSICRMNPASGWCVGCRRTIDEIVAWGRMDDDAKRTVWALIRQRRSGKAPTKGTAAPATPTPPARSSRSD